MISHSKKFVHIHLVKTGGTSRNKILSQYYQKAFRRDGCIIIPSPDQPPAEEMRYFVNENFGKLDNYFKFTFVRNPWDLVVSWFRERMVQSGRGRKIYKDSPSSFQKYIRQLKNKSLPYYSEVTYDYLQNQLSFLTKDGALFVDFIGKFETLDEDWKHVAEKLGIEQELPYLRSSTNETTLHYSKYYDEESKEIIKDLYKKDIEYFGYTFDKKLYD